MTTPAITRIVWIGPAAQDLAALPWPVEVLADGDAFLLSGAPFGESAYVVSTAQEGFPTLELLSLIRVRSAAPLLLLDAPGLPVLAPALLAGADMVLPEDAGALAVEAALRAIVRRAASGSATATWVVSGTEKVLTSPRSVHVQLSDAEHGVMLAFADANGEPVPRAELAAQLWGADAAGSDNALHAAIYRLRRRLEQECGQSPPIRALPRRGYTFDAPLSRGR